MSFKFHDRRDIYGVGNEKPAGNTTPEEQEPEIKDAEVNEDGK